VHWLLGPFRWFVCLLVVVVRLNTVHVWNLSALLLSYCDDDFSSTSRYGQSVLLLL
jgi:hypothetical protein